MEERLMLEMIRTASDTVFLTYFPEWREYAEKVKEQYFSIMKSIDKVYQQIRYLNDLDKKKYAKKASGHWFSFLLFGFVKENISKGMSIALDIKT